MSDQTVAPKAETEEIQWTKAQLKHFAELQQETARAQEAQNKFVGYLAQEYELDSDLKWQLGGKGFVRALAPTPSAAVQSPQE